jgi:hypothetical protein
MRTSKELLWVTKLEKLMFTVKAGKPEQLLSVLLPGDLAILLLFFQDLDDQDRREFLQDLQEGIFSSGMGMLNQQTLTDMAVDKLIGDNSLLTSSLNPATKVILDQIGLETSAGAILKQIVDSLSRGEELSAGNFFSGTTPSEYRRLN